MTTIKIADLDVDASRAEAHLRALEEQLGRTVSRADGLKAALLAAQRAIDEDAGSVQRLAAAFRQAEPQVETLGQRLRALGNTDLSGKLRAWAQGMAAPYMAASQLAGQVVSLGRSLLQTAVQSEAQDRALRQLGAAYHLVRQATNDTVSAQTALRAQQGLVQSGLQVTGEQLATITRAAREYALATGTETTQALEQLTDALRGNEAEGLQRFNVAAGQSADRARNFSNSLQQLADRQRGTGASARTLGEDMESLGRGFSTMVGHMARAVTQLGPVQAALRGLGSAIAAVNTHFEDEAIRARGREQAAAQQARDATRIERLSRIRARGVTGDLTDLDEDELRTVAGGGANTQYALDLVRRTRAARRAEAARRAQVAADQHGLQQWGGLASAGVEGGFTIGSDPEASGGGGNSDLARLQRLQLEVKAAEREVRALNAQFEEIPRRAGEGFAAYLERVQETLRRTRDAFRADREATEREITARAQELDARLRREASERGSVADKREGLAAEQRQRERETQAGLDDGQFRQRQAASYSTQFAGAFEVSAERTRTAAQSMAGSVRGAFDTMSGALKTHLAAVIQGKESIGEALRAVAHETLLSIATESFVRGLFETAQGLAALAGVATAPLAPAHFAAAGAYFGVAAATGIGAALTAPPAAAGASASAGGGSSFASAGNAGALGAGGGGATYVVNMNGAPFMTREDLQDGVAQLGSLAGARGRTPDYFRQSERRARMG